LSSFAQSNFYKISIGAGAGATQSFTEVHKHAFGLAGYGTLDYLFTPFISLGLEIQKGQINGGNYRTNPLKRQFINSYKAVSANGKIALGEFIDNNYNNLASKIRGLYIGGGIGVIQNNLSYAIRGKDDPDAVSFATTTTKDFLFPLDLGMNFYFADQEGFYRYVLNFNYQGNITLTEKLDGYDDTFNNHKSGNPDIYTFLSVGLKYNFGKIGLSRKTFRGR
jgi:hypothetical protein